MIYRTRFLHRTVHLQVLLAYRTTAITIAMVHISTINLHRRSSDTSRAKPGARPASDAAAIFLFVKLPRALPTIAAIL